MSDLETLGSAMNFDEHSRFPVAILYDDGDMSIDETSHALTVCRSVDLKAGANGRFAASTIVDSAGFAWRMNGVEEVVPPNLFRKIGYSFGQPIRVRPKIVGDPELVDLAWFKKAVIDCLKKPNAVTITLKIVGGVQGCTTLEKKASLGCIPHVQLATSVADVITTVLATDFPERQRWLAPK